MSTLVETVTALYEKYCGSINTVGSAEKHIPLTTVTGTTLHAHVPHVMDAEQPHFIEYMWFTDTTSKSVLASRAFQATDPSPATLEATVPTGSVITVYAYCNLHGLWASEPVTISS